MSKFPRVLIICCFIAGIFLRADAAVRTYSTANGQLTITHNSSDEGLYFDVNSNEIAKNVQIINSGPNTYQTIYHSEPKKTAGMAYPGDSIKSATLDGPFNYVMSSPQTFRIFGHPTDTASMLYSTQTYDLNTASSGGANPMVVKGPDDDPNYYMMFLSVCDDNVGHSGSDFRHWLCHSRTSDFNEFELKTIPSRSVEWTLFNESVADSWRRPALVYDENYNAIASINATTADSTAGLKGSICYYNNTYYYFYTDVDTDGRTYLYYRQTDDIGSIADLEWNQASKVITSPLMDNATVRVAKACDIDRWAVIYSGYHSDLTEDIFVQCTENMNIIGSGGISGLQLYDSFQSGYTYGISSSFLGLSSGGYCDHYYMTDDNGSLTVPPLSGTTKSGILTYSGGTYGDDVYWAGFTVSFPGVSYFIPADMDTDGDVDFGDLKRMADYWLTSDSVSDLNDDGTVNLIDFSIVGNLWHVDRLSLAELCFPDINKALPGHSVRFQWSCGKNVEEYYLKVGTTGADSNDVFDGSTGTAQNQLVSGMPVDGSNVYVRLFSKINGQWCYNDYVYTGFSYALAEMTTPTPGSMLPGAGVTFQWTTGLNVEEYCLEVGTTTGANDLYFGYTTNTSQQVGGIPKDNCPVYVRLWSGVPGHPSEWLYNDYQYDAYKNCGETWVEASYQGGRSFNGAHGNGSIFVAVGDPIDDPVAIPTEEWYTLLVWTSPDGINWTRVHLPHSTYGRHAIMDVTWDGSKFIAVGSNGLIMTSPNGTSWTKQTPVTTDRIWDIAYGNGTYIACGGLTTVLRSTDGANTWSPVSGPFTSYTRMVEFGNGRFVIKNTNSRIYTSDDNGLTWIHRQTLPNLSAPSLAYGADGWVTGGMDTTYYTGDPNDPNSTRFTAIWHSPDANSWTKVYDNYPGTASYLRDITYTDCNRYVANGTYGFVITSDDGINWTQRVPNQPGSPPYSTFMGNAYTNGKVIGVGGYSIIYYSNCDCDCD